METKRHRSFIATLAIAALGFAGAIGYGNAAGPVAAANCPAGVGWSEGLANYLKADAEFPTTDTQPLPTPDCNFHEWSWEAFVWATALLPDPASGTNVPRFMMMPTPEDLLVSSPDAGKLRLRPLKLAARSHLLAGTAGFAEGAGAIVQADGYMQVALNGYPVYASVHMNESYFETAKQNLIFNGGYQKQPADSSFNTGAAVFKATWLRLDPGQRPPAGAYTTLAQVPVLTTYTPPGMVIIGPVPHKFVTVTVALVGLHVVGSTINHPEFLWGTFEHKMNSPQTPDNTFTAAKGRKDPKDYTFYKANTSFADVNQHVNPPVLMLDEPAQKISPVTNVVLENQTGGENQPNGPGNIMALNGQSQSFLSGLRSPQSTFANYSLIGTVWMAPNSYNLKSDETNAVGSVNLANATAETFEQYPQNAPMKTVQNCFMCHNATSFSGTPDNLPNRLIALSHVLAVATSYAVRNDIVGKVPMNRSPKLNSQQNAK